MYKLRISNVVCTAWAGQSLSLRMVQLASQGRLDAKVFPSNVSRGRCPATTNSVFDTGRILITGGPSVAEALYAAKQYIDKLNQELGTDLHVLNFKVQNIVCSFSLGYRLDMHRFHVDHRVTRNGTAHYEPQLFRGCSWKPLNGLVFVLFESGKVVLTGARTWQEAEQAYHQALPELAKYEQLQPKPQHQPTMPTFEDVDEVDVMTRRPRQAGSSEDNDDDMELMLGGIIDSLQVQSH